ncbi:hypothetical protein WKW50_24105 [Ochrobactrum sp. GPK 3]
MTDGKVFLENAEKAIITHIAADAFEPLHGLRIAGLYRRARHTDARPEGENVGAVG